MPFQKGKVANPNGRPRRRVEEGELRLMAEIVNDPERRAIVRKALEQAKDGDHKAREWIWDRLFGKATAEVRLGNLEGEVFKMEYPTRPEGEDQAERIAAILGIRAEAGLISEPARRAGSTADAEA